jgi:hypothetical protein
VRRLAEESAGEIAEESAERAEESAGVRRKVWECGGKCGSAEDSSETSGGKCGVLLT